jgi:hypothetical protein
MTVEMLDGEALHFLEGQETILADLLLFQQMAVEMAAQLEQGGEVLQSTAAAKVLCVIEHHLRAQGASIFQVLFEGTYSVWFVNYR